MPSQAHSKPIETWRVLLGDPKSLIEAERNYRRRMLAVHPDVGGDAALAVELNTAVQVARRCF
jgi:hypothetical protein